MDWLSYSRGPGGRYRSSINPRRYTGSTMSILHTTSPSLSIFQFMVMVVCLACSSHIHAAIVFFEDVGTTASPSGQTIASYSGFTSGLTFEGNISESTVITPPSLQSGGYSGASGGSQFGLLQSNGQSTTLVIRGIDTSSYQPNSFDLSFGLRKSLSSGFAFPLSIQATTNDRDFVAVDVPLTLSNSNWQLYSGTSLDLPSSSNLSLYISKSPGFTAPIDVFIDDIRLNAITAVPEPSSGFLVVLGTACFVVGRRRQRKSRSLK